MWDDYGQLTYIFYLMNDQTEKFHGTFIRTYGDHYQKNLSSGAGTPIEWLDKFYESRNGAFIY